MPLLDTKFYKCARCEQEFMILVTEKPELLTPDQKRILTRKEIMIFKLGDKFKCPECGNEDDIE